MFEKISRTFISIPVPNEVQTKKNMLYTTLERCPSKINWVKNKQLHITVKYLGNTPETAYSKIIDSLSDITKSINPFEVFIKGTGCFPSFKRPKVLWMGVNGDLDSLSNLFLKVEKTLEPLGFSIDNQEYVPHITIAKIKYPQKYTPDISEFSNSYYDPIVFNVDRVQFLSSELLSSGAVHSLLKSFPLGESL